MTEEAFKKIIIDELKEELLELDLFGTDDTDPKATALKVNINKPQIMGKEEYEESTIKYSTSPRLSKWWKCSLILNSLFDFY